MVGHLGKDALAATGIGAVIFYLAWLIGFGPVMAVSPIVAQTLGAHPNDRARVRATVRMGFYAIGLMSPVLMVALLWARPVLVFLGQDPKIAAMAEPWVQVISIGLPFWLGTALLRGFATAVDKQRPVLAVAIATVLVNIAANYVFIYGHFGVPAFGLVGSAIASTIAYVFSFATLLTLMLLAPAFNKYRLLHRFFRPDWRKFKEIFWLGLPMGSSLIFEAMLFNSATLIMGTFGATAVAAHQVALNIPSVTFMVPLGIGMAATVRVGLAVGARNAPAARLAGHTAIMVGCGFMALCGVVIAAMPETLAGLYLDASDPNNAGVIPLAGTFLYVAAAFQLFDALQVTAQSSLRGIKDARAPMWIAGLSYWLIGFPLAYGLAKWAGLEGLGVWLGLLASLGVAGVGMLWRWEILSRRAL
jgi:MATE family multidrug resistance protein